jgi:hypothetical protein
MKDFLFRNSSGFHEGASSFEATDFIDVTTGVADAGKPIKTDAGGLIDGSFIDDSDIDHGSIGGLGDDDHIQYILVAGTRAFTGDQSMGGNQLTSVGDPTATTIDSASDDAIPMSFLASTASGEGASKIGIQDAAGYFTSNNVEGALAELFNNAGGPSYTAGVNLTKGDLVYVSANNTVSKTGLTTNAWSIGLALSTATATNPVVVTSNDQVLTGVLTGATAGTTYFWNGTTHSATIPSGSGQYVWKTGVAKNATDLHVEVEFIAKNSV